MSRAHLIRTSVTLLVARDMTLNLLSTVDSDLSAVDAIILAAAIQANVSAATVKTADDLAYAGLQAIPPDAVRRPISINRLAQSLEMPFETVRRRVNTLVRKGRLRVEDGGVVVPAANFQSQTRMEAVLRTDAFCAEAHRRLVRCGFFDAKPLPPPLALSDVPPVRSVARQVTEFCLRMAPSLIQWVGDYNNALILMQTHRLNTGPLDDDLERAIVQSAGRPQFDLRVQPASATAVSRELRFPQETTRRRLVDLAQRGACVKVSGGYVLPPHTLAPTAATYSAGNERSLMRLFRGCAEVGAVEHWRRQEAA